MKHKRIMTIIFILLLSLAGCSKLPSDEGLKNGYNTDPGSYISDEVNGDKISKEEQGYQNQTERPSVPKQMYIDYINAHKGGGSITSEDIIFYSEEDIDLDGNEEAVIALGTQDEYPLFSDLSEIYVMRNQDDDIKQIGDNLAYGGYGVYEVKLINLQGKPQKYIYCGLTNGNLRGFKIIELRGNEIHEICYSASGTGSGDDELKDFNEDGQYDGYVESRRSYDVLYFPTQRTYVYKDNEFVLENTWVDIPEYPKEAEEVMIQYFALSLLEDEKSKEVTDRLTKIYEKHVAQNSIVPYSVMEETLMITGEGLNISLEDIGEGCKEGTISFTDEYGMGHQYYIILSTETIDGRWRIEDIQKL
jgi:hypothetical protein